MEAGLAEVEGGGAAWLDFGEGEVDGAGVYARGGAGFEAHEGELKLAQRAG